MKRSPLRRGDPLRRSRPLRAQSATRQREQRERRRVMREFWGDEPLCAIRWDDRCRVWADAPHELRKASQGGSRVDPDNCIPACGPCNVAIEDHPVEAHRRGFVIYSWEG